ncbi:hypothetical protein QGN29_09165 [Temperatibacter marinus]|uniref:Uncharacterized protein n=1 Tax=Temperatibacter marinus TaxID=1456591 RepID=A0AA52EDL3_9PROT|nr:hypothetical protein [Temperatibacter marinus]WND01723.1 hypothetical protein QGN29_09165 [Temperatibacter marinus]
MRNSLFAIISSLLLVLSLAPAIIAEDNPLAIFASYADKNWVHDNGKSTPERFQDISKWRWILNKKAIRTSHSVNDGVYEGETHIFYDPATKTILMNYVTTAGFYTVGSAQKVGEEIHFHETVKGNTGGITDVEAKSSITAEGHMVVSSRMKSKGAWSKWSTRLYKQLK